MEGGAHRHRHGLHAGSTLTRVVDGVCVRGASAAEMARCWQCLLLLHRNYLIYDLWLVFKPRHRRGLPLHISRRSRWTTEGGSAPTLSSTCDGLGYVSRGAISRPCICLNYPQAFFVCMLCLRVLRAYEGMTRVRGDFVAHRKLKIETRTIIVPDEVPNRNVCCTHVLLCTRTRMKYLVSHRWLCAL